MEYQINQATAVEGEAPRASPAEGATRAPVTEVKLDSLTGGKFSQLKGEKYE